MAAGDAFTDREILRRLRAEFDHLFAHRNMIDSYSSVLERMVRDRLDEAGLAPGCCGTGGIASLAARS